MSPQRTTEPAAMQPSAQEGGTHVSQEPAARCQWAGLAVLQLCQETLAVEVIELLQVPKNNAALPSKGLGQVCSFHFWKVVVDDVP